MDELIRQAIAVQLARRGSTKTWLASEVGMSLPALSARLTGKQTIDISEVERIALALGMTGFQLLAAAEQESEPAA